MTTFTIGLGVDGVMTFREDYATATAGDFYHIRTGSTNPADRSSCPWQAAGTVCNWPVPAADTETAVDDLWHAAVNGHGTYFSAKDPESMARGLANALNNLKVRNGAASASATSTPNVTQDDNDIFSATFRTVKWDGELVAQKIDPATGNLMPAVTWQAQALLDNRGGRRHRQPDHLHPGRRRPERLEKALHLGQPDGQRARLFRRANAPC